MDVEFLLLIGRCILINVVPFFFVFHLVMRRRRNRQDKKFNELELIVSEVQIVGLLGYFIILSIFFFSIPVIVYLNTRRGYDIIFVEPDGYFIAITAFISFLLVAGAIFMKYQHVWAYRLTLFLINLLLFLSFFFILEVGVISFVPVILFAYLSYRLTRHSLKRTIIKDKS
jgi:hypothetical protein